MSSDRSEARYFSSEVFDFRTAGATFLKVNGLLDESNLWDKGSDIRILKAEDNQASFGATYDRFLLELLSFSEAGDDLEMLKNWYPLYMLVWESCTLFAAPFY